MATVNIQSESLGPFGACNQIVIKPMFNGGGTLTRVIVLFYNNGAPILNWGGEGDYGTLGATFDLPDSVINEWGTTGALAAVRDYILTQLNFSL